MNALSTITRICRSGIPRRHSILTLADPKLRMSGRQRRQLMRSRDLVVVRDESPDPLHPAVKMTMRLSKLPLVKLLRRQHQFARRASTARHIALKLPPGGVMRATMEQQAGTQLGFFKQANGEIDARMLAVQNKLAETKI